MNANLSRRTVVAGCALVAANLGLGGAVRAFAGDESILLRPPSAQDDQHVYETCIKCERCRSACPQSCIRTGALEDGLLNWRTPILDFHRGICDFCGKCAQACPTGTITSTDPEVDLIGVAVVDRDLCMAWTGTSCLKCADVCPYEAISRDDWGRPVIDEGLCNGCGICEYVCPSNTYRSYSCTKRRGVNVEK